MHTRCLSAAAAITLAAAALHAQSCSVNLVPNGDFESLFFDPWQTTGTVTYPTNCSVDGLTTSRCVSGQTSFTLTQPTAFMLQAGTTYEVGLDVYDTTTFYNPVSVGLTEGGNRTVVINNNNNLSTGRNRYLAHFTPQTTTAFTIDIANTGGGISVDNLYVRPATISLRVDGYSNRGRTIGQTNAFTILGPTNSNVVVFVGVSGQLPQGVSLGFCAGEWRLAPPSFEVALASLNQNGIYQFSLTFPTFGKGIPFEWQAAVLPPNCELGCPFTYAFF